ncbi:uncharacterized protein P884DRAFT_303977 [Thermothelomyces heterothallicus CBS 202.75]|uniref:uncharacterized protein n=1 Tax=Thermothelomyces heterothallicus CBS 202.75 TaxID=1149848 RepID=UPI003742E38E
MVLLFLFLLLYCCLLSCYLLAAPSLLIQTDVSLRISTLALGGVLAGSWYVWEAGRDYMVAAEADKYEPRLLGTHREGKVNRDYVNYEQWVEEKHRNKK